MGTLDGVWPVSRTPNSFIDSLPAVGDVPRDGAKTVLLTRRLALRAVPFALSVGEFVAEDRLEIRGIFVGVSFDKEAVGFRDEGGGGSLEPSLT